MPSVTLDTGVRVQGNKEHLDKPPHSMKTQIPRNESGSGHRRAAYHFLEPRPDVFMVPPILFPLLQNLLQSLHPETSKQKPATRMRCQALQSPPPKTTNRQRTGEKKTRRRGRGVGSFSFIGTITPWYSSAAIYELSALYEQQAPYLQIQK